MPDLVEILVTAKNLTTPAFAEAKAGATAMESSMSRLNKAADLAGLALVGFAAESVKMASDFDSKMMLLQTQAGVSKDKIAGLKAGVLDLAGQVGFSPDSLAESLYHVESNFESMGISSQKALDLTKIAAEGAAIGHAKLVDVTNALTAAVASGIPGVQDFSQAMGVLNATVGVGDMSMQDLASAFGSGMVATVKGFGLTIADVGAGLAVFGDNNIRGAAAGTQLRMSVQALAQPVASGADALKRLGLTTQTLADDMQKGGLKLAIEDLNQHMQKAGITADQQGEIITQAFGRKAGAGLNVLMDQVDRFESKYPALEAGANSFGQAWEDTQKTFSQQMKQMQGSLDALMIKFGEQLIPVIQKTIGFFQAHSDATLRLAEVTGVLVTALAGFAAVTKVIALFKALDDAFTVAETSMAAFKLKMFEVQVASAGAGGGLSTLGAAFEAMGTKAKVALAAGAIGLLVTVMIQLRDASRNAPPDINRMTDSLTNLGRVGQSTGELITTFGTNLDKLGSVVDRVAGKSSGMDHFNDVMNKIFTLGMAKSNSLDDANKQIGALDQGLANLVQGGHADLAAAAVKRLDDAMAAQGKNPAELNKELQLYGDALRGLATQDGLTADSMGALGQQAVATAAKLKTQQMTAEGLKEAIVDLNNVNRSALDSMAGFEQSIADASKAVDANGAALHYTHGELDLTTQAARDNEKALSDLAKKTDDAAEAALNNNEGMDKANEIYDRGKQKLLELAGQMGLTKEQAQELASQILSTPDKTVQLKADQSDLKSKVIAARQELADTQDSKTISLLADKSQLDGQVRRVRQELYDIPDRVVSITASFDSRFLDAGQPRAHGGIIGTAATGGARNGMTLVGEQGPELVKLPFGSTVYPAGQSRNMMQAAASGGPGKLQIEWVGGNAGDEFMQWLRKNIRILGGDVQTVLGQG